MHEFLWSSFEILGHFLENFDKKVCVFSASASPSKLVNMGGSERASRKNVASVSQKWKSQNSTKRRTFGSTPKSATA